MKEREYSDAELEAISYDKMANLLLKSENHRVLRKFSRLDAYNEASVEEKRIGVFLDVETTGLDFRNDKIIELALVPFEYTLDGRIFRVLEGYSSFQDPAMVIPENIVSLTGISNGMVRGHVIDKLMVKGIIGKADLIIAHNSAFDRKFVEKQFPIFATKRWACSLTEIPWVDEGISTSKLEYLAYKFGFFYDAHRAEVDCLVGIHILAQMLPISNNLAMKVLLSNSNKKTYRIWAEGSPFDTKDILKARGYKWSDGSSSNPKSWFIEVDDDRKEGELNFLYEEIYKNRPRLNIQELSALNRFST